MKSHIEYRINKTYPDTIVLYTPQWREIFTGRGSWFRNLFQRWHYFPFRAVNGNVYYPDRYETEEKAMAFVRSITSLNDFFKKFNKSGEPFSHRTDD